MRTAIFALVALFSACAPAFSQIAPQPEPDPLARIRAQSQAQTQACSEAEPTLCAEAAPKIIANAMGDASGIEKSLQQVDDEFLNHAAATPTAARLVDWAVATFRAAGADVHTEAVSLPSDRPGHPIQEQNVVAEIRGRELPNEIVVLGAHLDSWLLASGDLDDDADVVDPAIVIEAARDILATGLVPRRTIRFVLFAGIGLGQSVPGSTDGSSSYVRAHRDEMDRTRAVIIFPERTDYTAGYSLAGRNDIEPGVREALAPLGGVGALIDSFDGPPSVDDLDFILEGVPTIVAHAGATNRPPGDPEFSEIDFKGLKRSAAIAGVTAFDVAEDVAPLGPRLSRAEIEALLLQTGLDREMKNAGVWPLWENGQLGRQP